MATDSRNRGISGSLLSSPLEGVTGVWKLSRDPGGYHRARSLPGHLLHLILTGSYRLRTNAREYEISTGHVIYYHETEEVEWLSNAERVVFYSVGFLAPELAPLPLDARVFPSSEAVRSGFAELYAAGLLPRGTRRALRLHAALLAIILQVEPWNSIATRESSAGAVGWHEIESLIREQKLFRPTLAELSELTHRSRASIVRACRAATGTSPMKRVRDIRMAEARGLLRFSHLNISQVADYLGYPRLHEFSREFSRRFGAPPSVWRRG